MRKHYVTFYSPGTFVAEESTKPIAEWDTRLAMKLAADVVERYGARPYGFRFTTCIEREFDDGEGGTMGASKKVATSPMHYINAKVRTLADVEREEPGSVLASNMRINDWPEVVEAGTGYRWTGILGKDDVLVDVYGTVRPR